jgi:putative transposase
MKKNRHSSEPIVKMLREAEAKIAEGQTVEEIRREMGVSEATYYKWRKSYGQMPVDQVKRLKDLEKENGRLKKLVADLSLDKAILQEALSGKY